MYKMFMHFKMELYTLTPCVISFGHDKHHAYGYPPQFGGTMVITCDTNNKVYIYGHGIL
jgi:hypothetical protein